MINSGGEEVSGTFIQSLWAFYFKKRASNDNGFSTGVARPVTVAVCTSH